MADYAEAVEAGCTRSAGTKSLPRLEHGGPGGNDGSLRTSTRSFCWKRITAFAASALLQ
jgi:hypothetical protein